jgi:Nucleotidyl transferase AbiEii toxin, Type IV TA system
VIGRFSEDIDITYDVRQLIPELAGDGTLPANNSQVKKWRDAIDAKLPAWVRDVVLPAINARVAATDIHAQAAADGANIYIDYDPLAKGTDSFVLFSRSAEAHNLKVIGCRQTKKPRLNNKVSPKQ